MAAVYMYTYTIDAGQHQRHDDWMKHTGIPFWQRQRGFRGFRSNFTLVGPGPDVVCEIEFDSPEDITRCMETPEAMRLFEEFSAMVRDLDTKIMVPAHFTP
ncbi:MAG: hypothetical protein HY690_14675 [Chloroflexi bacterium]|nr:hypothetical protein [Chloroflexota bacterium]